MYPISGQSLLTIFPFLFEFLIHVIAPFLSFQNFLIYIVH